MENFYVWMMSLVFGDLVLRFNHIILFLIIVLISVVNLNALDASATLPFKIPPSPGVSNKRHLHIMVECSWSICLNNTSWGWRSYGILDLKAICDSRSVTLLRYYKLHRRIGIFMYSDEDVYEIGFRDVGGRSFGLWARVEVRVYVRKFFWRLLAMGRVLGSYSSEASLLAMAFAFGGFFKIWYGCAKAATESGYVEASIPSVRFGKALFTRSMETYACGYEWSIFMDPPRGMLWRWLVLKSSGRVNLTLSRFVYDYTRTLKVSILDVNGVPIPGNITLRRISDVDGDLIPETNVFPSNDDPYVYYVWTVNATVFKAAPANLGRYEVLANETLRVGTNVYVFDHWEAYGGVMVSDPFSPHTAITVVDDGELMAVYKLVVAPVAKGLVELRVVDVETGRLWSADLMINGTLFRVNGSLLIWVELARAVKIEFVYAPSRNFLSWEWAGPIEVEAPFNESTAFYLYSNSVQGVIILTLQRRFVLYVDSSPIRNVTVYFVGNFSGYEDTPFILESDEPFRVLLTASLVEFRRVDARRVVFFFLYWIIDEKQVPFPTILIDVNRTKRAIAVYYTYSRVRIKVKSVRLVPCYSTSRGYLLANDSYLAPMEYMSFGVYVEAELVRVRRGPRGVQPAILNVTIRDPTFASYLRDPDTLEMEDVDVSFSFMVNQTGVSCVGYVGVWVIDESALPQGQEAVTYNIQYSWMTEFEQGDGTRKVVISAMIPRLYWIPLTRDVYAILIVYRWYDQKPVIGRRYVFGVMNGLEIHGGTLAAYKALINGNIPSVLTNLWKMSVAFCRIGAMDVPFLKVASEMVIVHGMPWIRDLYVPIHMLGLVVEEHTAERLILRLMDISLNSSVKGFVDIVVRDLETGGIREYKYETDDLGRVEILYEDIELPRKYELVAIGYAPGEGVIYLSLKPARISLARAS